MPVLLTQDEINTFEKNGVSSDDIQYTVDYYRSNGISDDVIRTKIDDKLNVYYNNYAREHQQPVLKGSVSYNDILVNDKLSREEKGQLIQARGEEYRKNLDNELKKQQKSIKTGVALKVLSPIAGLTPFVGVPLAGSIYGLGDSIENNNDFKTTLAKMGLYSGTSFLGGNVFGNVINKIPALKNKASDLILKSALKGSSIGGFDGLAEGINQGYNSNNYSPPEIAKYSLLGLTTGASLGLLGGLLPSRILNYKQNTESVENLRQFLRNKIASRRAFQDSNIFESTKLINDFIGKTKDFASKYKLNDKQIREIMPFIRENTNLPNNFDRKDLVKLYDSLSNTQRKELKNLADITSAQFEKYWNEYARLNPDVKTANPNTYITHLWKDNPLENEVLTNYFNSLSNSGKQRHIKSYKQGIEGVKISDNEILKLQPKTLDYAEILKEHASDVIGAIANTKFINLLRKIKTPDKLPLLSNTPDKNYIKIEHPSLGKTNYVHKHYASTLAPVLEATSSKTKIGKMYDKVNNFAKTCKFLLNGMHAVALTETAAAHEGIIPIKTLKTLTNVPKIIDGIKNNNYEIFKNNKLAKQAIKDGVQFGAISDISVDEFNSSLDDILKFLDKVTFGTSKIATKPLKATMELNNKVLWNYLHNTYKLHAYNTLIERTQRKFKEPLSKDVRREIGQIINDTFGGQNFDTLGIKPSTMQTARRLLLSPDWNISAFIRQSLSVFASENSQKVLNELANSSNSGAFIREFMRKIGISSFTNDVKAAGVRGDIARKFFFRFIIQSAIYANIVNVAFRSYDRFKNPEFYENNISDFNLYDNNRFNEDDSTLTKITDLAFPRPFVGRDSNNREKYARISKQAREVPEFVEDGYQGAIRKIASKSSPIVSPFATYAADKLTDGWNNDTILDRYKDVFKPYSLSSNEITPMSGVYSTSKGINYYQAKDYIKTSLEENNSEAIKNILPKLKANNINYNSVIKNASSEIMLEAMQRNDKNTIEKIWQFLDELDTDIDVKKIYSSAVYKYLESIEEDDYGKF